MVLNSVFAIELQCQTSSSQLTWSSGTWTSISRPWRKWARWAKVAAPRELQGEQQISQLREQKKRKLKEERGEAEREAEKERKFRVQPEEGDVERDCLPKQVPPTISSIGRRRAGCALWQAQTLGRAEELHHAWSDLVMTTMSRVALYNTGAFSSNRLAMHAYGQDMQSLVELRITALRASLCYYEGQLQQAQEAKADPSAALGNKSARNRAVG
ncbi:hypothetical protein AK812_SmicGene20546 [Symbiodinium microadriaticum]|uniref:Uncharacterized protein n=1 Tax=Symbiodinium microadriaticum TaxID=2951 RepID=A0A1Q9DPU8_SYMMI|nr:hypothetical protein AK812_SmicGene20546 [Symbiodinium microadriaticum]